MSMIDNFVSFQITIAYQGVIELIFIVFLTKIDKIVIFDILHTMISANRFLNNTNELHVQYEDIW